MHSSGEPLARAVVLAVAAWGSVVQAQAPAPVGGEASTLTAIRREVLPEVLRVTLELEGEAEVADSVLEGPPRVFVDLRNTETVARLRNVALTFPDDVVRQIRVGHHDNQRTRVVLDLADQNRHSVYLLYEPYRVVIDFERRRDVVAPDGSSETTSVAAARAPDAPQPPPPAPPAANGAGGFSLSRQLGLGISRIVVDPGHGGQDPGAQVEGLSEADVVLDVALRFERLMHALPGVEVILTRRENVYLPLDERTAVANAAGADLFLSIHANATRNTKALGIETYFLNFATTSAAEALAARENAGSTRSMGELTELVKAIATNNKMDESPRLRPGGAGVAFRPVAPHEYQHEEPGRQAGPVQCSAGGHDAESPGRGRLPDARARRHAPQVRDVPPADRRGVDVGSDGLPAFTQDAGGSGDAVRPAGAADLDA